MVIKYGEQKVNIQMELCQVGLSLTEKCTLLHSHLDMLDSEERQQLGSIPWTGSSLQNSV